MAERAEPMERESPAPWLLLVELLVVLCLGFLPNLFFAFVPHEDPSRTHFILGESIRTVHSLQVLIPLLYIMWRSDDGWAEFGIGKPDWLVDTTLSIMLIGLTLMICPWIASLFAPPLDPESLDELPRPSGYFAHTALLVSMTCNSLAEEFLMRAYLITRLRQLGAHVAMAVVVSAVLFASYHVYQGYWVIGPHIVLGLMYGATYVLTRRIWPLVVAHTAYNMFIYTAA